MNEDYKNFKSINILADRDRWPPEDRLSLHQMACRWSARFGLRGLKMVSRRLYDRVRHGDNLFLALRSVGDRSGNTPGVDGEVYDDIASDPLDYARGIGSRINAGEYEPAPLRPLETPKSSGTGTRLIQIPTLLDRTVRHSVVAVVGPLLDASFDPNSFGGRPGRERMHALAAAERLANAGRLVWLVEDLENAFDAVPQQRLLDVLGLRLPVVDNKETRRILGEHETLHGLLRKLILTGEGIGLPETVSSSPLFLNVYIDDVLDRRWRRKHVELPLLRFLDQLLIPCRSIEEAEGARQKLNRLLLRTGMRLQPAKPGQQTIHDLSSGQPVRWLGYTIGWAGGTLQVQLDGRTRDKWEEPIPEIFGLGPQRCHLKSKIRRWADQWGPAYPNTDRTLWYEWLVGRASRYGLDDLPSLTEFERAWEEAYQRWQKIRDGDRPATVIPDSPPQAVR